MDTNGDVFEVVPVDTFEVGTDVLFGDKEDVKLKHLKSPNEMPSEGGTILFTLRRRTPCFPGTWCHSMIKFDGGFYHLIHAQGCSGEKIGRHLLKCNTADFCDPNVWSRYDWCHWRNWGTVSTDDENEDEGTDDNAEEKSDDSAWTDDENEDEDTDDAAEEQSDDSRHKIYFVSISGDIVVSTVVLDDSCIEGDWNYGFRMTDPDSGLAFAYGFGDYLVNRELGGDVDDSDLTESLQVCKSKFMDE